MVRSAKVFIFLAIIAVKSLALPQYHRNEYHPSTMKTGIDQMNNFYQMPTAQHRQDHLVYPYTQSIFKHQEMPYEINSGMTSMMPMHKTSQPMNYHHQNPVYINGYSDTFQDNSKLKQEIHYDDEMLNGQYPSLLHYTSQGKRFLNSMEEKKQVYSPASAVTHVKFNGMGAMYE